MIEDPDEGGLRAALAQRTARLTRGQWQLLGVVAVAGLASWCASRLLGGDWRLPGLFGVFLLVYAAVVVAGSLPDRIVAEKLDAVLDRWVRDKSGKGFYGMVALSVLAWQEVDGLLDFSGFAEMTGNAIKSQIVHYVIGFSADAMRNAIHAAIWPMWLAGKFGAPGTAAFAGACWAVFALGRRHLPMPDLYKKPKRDEAKTADEPLP